MEVWSWEVEAGLSRGDMERIFSLARKTLTITKTTERAAPRPASNGKGVYRMSL